MAIHLPIIFSYKPSEADDKAYLCVDHVNLRKMSQIKQEFRCDAARMARGQRQLFLFKRNRWWNSTQMIITTMNPLTKNIVLLTMDACLRSLSRDGTCLFSSLWHSLKRDSASRSSSPLLKNIFFSTVLLSPRFPMCIAKEVWCKMISTILTKRGMAITHRCMK